MSKRTRAIDKPEIREQIAAMHAAAATARVEREKRAAKRADAVAAYVAKFGPSGTVRRKGAR